MLARDFKTPRENTWEESSRRPDDFLDETDFNNAEFEEYYRRQGVVPEGEWEEFMRVLRQPLPASFRINGSGKFASDLRDRLENDFFAPFKQGPLEARFYYALSCMKRTPYNTRVQQLTVVSFRAEISTQRDALPEARRAAQQSFASTQP